MPDPETNSSAEILRWLMEEWARGLAAVIESMTQERPDVEWIAGGEPPARFPNVLCWEQSLDLAPGAALYVATPENTWAEIGKRALVAAGIEDAGSATVRGAYLEILSQAIAALVRAIGSRFGRELVSGSSRETPALPDVSSWHLTQARFRDSASVPVFLGFNPAVEAALNGPPGKPAPEAPDASSAPAASSQPAPAAPPLKPESRTLDLLLDVEMPVSVSFGRAELLLKDVLKLATGSIVELNRSISEPVEVIVNNCVIARGEVVVIDGNYGIRISQIISRQERLRTLK